MQTVVARRIALSTVATMVICGSASAACLQPERPWLPSEAADIRTYADLIRDDFESYIVEVQDYFRCLDAERTRAFLEAQEVSQDYGRFQSTIGN